MTEPIQATTPPEEWGERISAYLDGELSPAEARAVERRLADDPAARRFADELRSLGRVCRAQPAPPVGRDLASTVVAEALRRKSEQRVELPDRLEPEGEFGLPFGKSARGWSWALVAAAAAVLIGFYGRPAAPTGAARVAQQPTPRQIEQSLAQMQRVAPGLQVVNYQATPDRLARLRRLLAQRSAQPATMPGALMNVSQRSGVALQPADPSAVAAGDATEEVLCLDADEAELDRLLKELDSDEDGSLVRVESDPNPADPTAQPVPPAKPAIRGVWRVRLDPEAAAKLLAQQRNNPQAALTAPGGRRFIVLHLQVKPKP